MARNVTPFLMFDANAQAAPRFHISLLADSGIARLECHGPGAEGRAHRAEFTVAGQRLICIDSPVRHPFTFTPSISLFVECESQAEPDSAFGKLSADGAVLMPPGKYGFSTGFAWLNDRSGVSRQLNLT